MTRVTLDASTLAKLHNLAEFAEFCDESGKTLGYFHPLGQTAKAKLQSPLSDEELQRRRQQTTGRPLSEILRSLEQS